MKHASTSEQITVKFKKIHVPESFNIRRDLPEVKELAAGIAERGLLQPVVVRNGGTDANKPYTLVSGARRMAAYELLGWQDREILAVVRQYEPGDALGPIADNWAENMDRKDVSTLEQAERVFQLVSGKYPVDEGMVAEPVDQDTIAKLFNISKRHVQKLAKIARDVDPDVALKAYKNDAPSHIFITISQIEGEGETKEEKEEDRAKKQEKKLDGWIDHQAALAAAGRQRAPSEKGKGKGKGKAAKRGKLAASEEEEWGAINPEQPLDKKERTAADLLQLLLFMHDQKLPKEVAARIEGALFAVRFLSGEITKLPFVSEQDWKAYTKVTEEAAEDGGGGEDAAD